MEIGFEVIENTAKEVAEKGMNEIKRILYDEYDTTLEEIQILSKARLAGRIVIPPCKPGDDLYILENGKIRKTMCISYNIEISEDKSKLIETVDVPADNRPYFGREERSFLVLSKEDFGKTVFTNMGDAFDQFLIGGNSDD